MPSTVVLRCLLRFLLEKFGHNLVDDLIDVDWLQSFGAGRVAIFTLQFHHLSRTDEKGDTYECEHQPCQKTTGKRA